MMVIFFLLEGFVVMLEIGDGLCCGVGVAEGTEGTRYFWI
jgi:hypothetical protein